MTEETRSTTPAQRTAQARRTRPPAVPEVFVQLTEEVLDITLPDHVRALYARPPVGAETVLYRPDLAADDPMSLAAAMKVLATSAQPTPHNILPLAPVDDRSFAVVVCQKPGHEPVPGVGAVLRWHLDRVPDGHQGALLDITAEHYLNSLTEELAARGEGLKRITIEAKSYRERHVEHGTRPKSYELRPVQLACQNVVVGLAAFRHDSTFDGLSVPMWQTCEAPHLAAHEGARALAVFMLCDAFASGGTMEIRFRGHPEKAVPAALRRFARTRGISLGTQEKAVITPEEARALFRAVTPMPAELACRAADFIDRGVLAPERLSYVLLAGVWQLIEVDFLLATSGRAASVLAGGAEPEDRRARAAETEVCRSALMAGTLLRRLDAVDAAGRTGQTRVFEDSRRGVTWSVLGEYGAVEYRGVHGPLPWLPPGRSVPPAEQDLIAVPRAHPTTDDVQLAHRIGQRTGKQVVIVVPADRVDFVDCSMPVLRCPDTVHELDTAIEDKLLTARVSRV
ncbi:hypothetical protein ACH4XT_29030 [Streptomyces avidinii]|uniref:hypothetical protein n=1 Tax=Streptomyces avidinii TaxID=1895 RepID=UPI00379A2605